MSLRPAADFRNKSWCCLHSIKYLVVCSRLLITCIRSSSSLNEIVKLDTASTDDDAANARPGSEDLESDANAYDCLAEQCEQSHKDV